MTQTFKFPCNIPGLESETVNFIDDGPVSDTKVRLAINEFDVTLRSSLNFGDPECFKALVLPLGLEELRAIVAYEIMHLQLLVVATQTNQIQLDNCQRRSCEIDFMEQGFAVANPVLPIFQLMQGQNLLEAYARRIPKNERSKLNSYLGLGVSDNFYSIQKRKEEPKDEYELAYSKLVRALEVKRG